MPIVLYEVRSSWGCLQFLFTLTHVELIKYYFSTKFKKWRFWWICTFWDPLSPKNHIFSVWSACIRVCMSIISITQKQITVEILDLVFYICIIYRCYLKFFYKDRIKALCTGAHKKILIHYGLWIDFLVSEFSCI